MSARHHAPEGPAEERAYQSAPEFFATSPDSQTAAIEAAVADLEAIYTEPESLDSGNLELAMAELAHAINDLRYQLLQHPINSLEWERGQRYLATAEFKLSMLVGTYAQIVLTPDGNAQYN